MAIAKDFIFFGRLCLDFAHTGDMGYGSAFERLKSPADLNRWLTLSQLRLPGIRISNADLRRARVLRGAIWRVASALVARDVPVARDLRLINRTARHPGLVSQLTLDAQAMRWNRPTISAAIATLAQDSVRLFGDARQRERIHRCENSGCQVIFYDDSRPGLRRWCAPNRCGDRMRARFYRERHQKRDS